MLVDFFSTAEPLRHLSIIDPIHVQSIINGIDDTRKDRLHLIGMVANGEEVTMVVPSVPGWQAQATNSKSRLPASTMSRSRRVAFAPSSRSASQAARRVSGVLIPMRRTSGRFWKTRTVSPSITRTSSGVIGAALAMPARAMKAATANRRILAP